MNRGIKMSAMVDKGFNEVEVDMDVIDVSPHEMLSLFGTLMGYVLRDFFKGVDEDEEDYEESFNLLMATAIETYMRLAMDELLEEISKPKESQTYETPSYTDINFDMNQIDNALNKILEDFENGR